MSNKTERMDQETTKQAGQYLFRVPADESQALNMRTRIHGDKMVKVLTYYNVIGVVFDCTEAIQIKDTMELLLISSHHEGRDGRLEAVEVLKQNFPKRVEVEKGWDVPE